MAELRATKDIVFPDCGGVEVSCGIQIHQVNFIGIGI